MFELECHKIEIKLWWGWGIGIVMVSFNVLENCLHVFLYFISFNDCRSLNILNSFQVYWSINHQLKLVVVVVSWIHIVFSTISSAPFWLVRHWWDCCQQAMLLKMITRSWLHWAWRFQSWPLISTSSSTQWHLIGSQRPTKPCRTALSSAALTLAVWVSLLFWLKALFAWMELMLVTGRLHGPRWSSTWWFTKRCQWLEIFSPLLMTQRPRVPARKRRIQRAKWSRKYLVFEGFCIRDLLIWIQIYLFGYSQWKDRKSYEHELHEHVHYGNSNESADY